MTLAATLTSTLTRSLTVGGPPGGNNAPANVTVKCGAPHTVDIVQQLSVGTCTIGDHITGGATADVAAGGAGNCYWLPWFAWRAYVGHLGAAADFFLTPNLTGCGFIVSGNATDPYVCHANCAAGEMVAFPASGNVRTYNDDLTAARMQFYGQISAELVRLAIIPSANLQMLRPEDYGARASEGFSVPTSVFGRRTGGNWTIYYNVGSGGRGMTRQLFPDFQRL